MTWYHPKYYAQLRKEAKLQAKVQASKLTGHEPPSSQAPGSKPASLPSKAQASSPSQPGPGSKHQGTSVPSPYPGNKQQG